MFLGFFYPASIRLPCYKCYEIFQHFHCSVAFSIKKYHLHHVNVSKNLSYVLAAYKVVS